MRISNILHFTNDPLTQFSRFARPGSWRVLFTGNTTINFSSLVGILLMLLVSGCSGGSSGGGTASETDTPSQNPQNQNPLTQQPNPRNCSCVMLSLVCTLGQGCVPFHFCSGCGGPPANRPPIAAISAPSEWSLGRGSIMLDGSASSDANGDAINYDWILASVPPGSQATLSAAENIIGQLTPDKFGRYIVTLVVNDGEDESNTAYAFIDVESTDFSDAETRETREVITVGNVAGFRSAILIDANEDGVNDMVMGSCDDQFNVLLRSTDSWSLSQIVTTDNFGFCHDVSAVGDFNNDGHSDVAIGREIFVGDGLGQFTLWVQVDNTDFVSGMASGDFNGDGIDDLAIGLNETKLIRVLFGGSTLPLRTSSDIANPLGLGVVPIHHVNKALSDFVFYATKFDDEGKSELGIVLGTNTENYAPVISELPGFGSIGAGDLNGDGNGDIVLSVYGGTILVNIDGRTQRIDTDVRIATLLGNGDGTFKAPRFDGAADHATGGITITDINRDGLQDVLLLAAAPVRISVLLGNGQGGYSSLTVLPELPSGIPTAGDADGDGLIDVILPTGANNGIWTVWGMDMPF